MRISLRTSGGRGEYEFAGRQGARTTADLENKRLYYQLTPDLVIDGRSEERTAQGKPRIRLLEGGHHLYRVLSDVLLLPRPIRELRQTAESADFVRNGKFVVKDIDIDVAQVEHNRATIRPTNLWLANRAGLQRRLEIAGRVAVVQALWDAAAVSRGPVAEAVSRHARAVTSGDFWAIQEACNLLRRTAGSDSDPLVAAGRVLGVNEGALAEEAALPEPPTEERPQDDDDTTPVEANARMVAKMREVVDRGPAGRRFSEAVKTAYNFRCLVMGTRLPRLPGIVKVAGVDGAHIVPWARDGLNDVKNGLCLCKLCHWAFDHGVLRIDFEGGQYVVSVPERVRSQAGAAGLDIDMFSPYLGAIPSSRLPSLSRHRPAPEHLEKLNSMLFGRT